MSAEKKAAVTRYHRKTLLDAADRLIMEHGYDGMNMNMLAKEAGYSKATVYVYFDGKDEIVRQLCVERLKLLRREFAVILNNGADADEMKSAVKSVLDEFAEDDRTYFDFVCEGKFAAADSDASESAKQLSELVCGIFDDLTALAPRDELKRKWFEYYGRIKTNGIFGEDGD